MNVVDVVIGHAEATPRAVALRKADGDVTYAELLEATLAFGGVLRAAGVGIGERVVLIAPSVPEFVIAFLGAQAAGCIVVPMNTMATVAEITYVVEDAEASALVGWHELGPAHREAAAARGIPLLDLRPDGPRTDAPRIEVIDRMPSDTAAILYTSGTTGRPKGAELTVANLLDSAAIAAQVGHATRESRYGSGLPLFHIFGQNSVMMAALSAGASISLLARFEPHRMLELIDQDRLTHVIGVPTMWNAMLHASDVGDVDLSSVRVAISGGAALPAEMLRAFEQRFGCRIMEGFGMTETTGLGTFSDLRRGGKPGSVGPAVPRTRIEIRDADGAVRPAGEVGELFLSGPSIMKGYWRRPEATAETLVDGWLRTGDLGEIDADGDLRISGRLKELIIRGGYNVYPAEVEDALYEHPDVVEAAVLGVPHEHYGEEVAAVVVLRQGAALEGADLTAWVRERLSAYKIPRIVRFVDSLPKGASGKIHKRAIDIESLVGASGH